MIPTEDQAIDRLTDKSQDALYAQIVERIRQWVLRGYLKEDELLPSERELAQIFGVSRVPVREALKVLEFLGVVQNVRGKGVYVRKINISNVLNNIDFMIMAPEHGLEELFEVREALESKAASLAALRRDQKDLETMEGLLLEMERNILFNKDMSETSLHFHSSIIAASHNKVMVKVNEFLSDLLKFSRTKSFRDQTRSEVSFLWHKQIFQKIKAMDAAGASLVMREHLQESNKALLNE